MEEEGKQMHSDDADLRRQAARMLGSARTEKKGESSRANAAKRRGVPLSEEHRAKIQQKALERWEKVRSEADAPEPTEKRPPGRPRTRPVDTEKPVRPRGRPRLYPQEGQAQ